MASTLRRGVNTSRGDLLMYAKTMSAAAAAVLFSLVAIDGAAAAGGCGPGFHRNEFGRCRPNGAVVVAPGASCRCPGCASCRCPAGRGCPSSGRLRRRLPLASALSSLRRSVKPSKPNLVSHKLGAPPLSAGLLLTFESPRRGLIGAIEDAHLAAATASSERAIAPRSFVADILNSAAASRSASSGDLP